MSRVIFRADASLHIGYGHVVRCIALARILVSRGVDIHFVCRELRGDYCANLESLGFKVHRLPEPKGSLEDDATLTLSILQVIGPSDWLVVDHYALDARWEQAMRHLTKRILVIDDQANRNHDCDLLLDQNVMAIEDDRYVSRTPAGTRFLLGPKYALLRAEFARHRNQRPVRDGSVRRVLVCFGGTDPQQHSIAVLKALSSCVGSIEHIDVATGTANPHREALAIACAELPTATLHSPACDMARLLGSSDLAIGAGGGMNWERACLGVPTLAFGIADNQISVLSSLIEAGFITGVPDMPVPDEARILAWLNCLLDNPALLRGLSTRIATLVDGRGAERVAEAMFPEPLTFRPATLSDSDNFLSWRNDPAIRHVSHDPREIDRETHSDWIKKTLADPQRILLVAECDGQPVGVVRFDLFSTEAVISVYRVPCPNAAPGLIRKATAWLHEKHPKVLRIRAEVLSDNEGSLAAFRAAGYRDSSNMLIYERNTP